MHMDLQVELKGAHPAALITKISWGSENTLYSTGNDVRFVVFIVIRMGLSSVTLACMSVRSAFLVRSRMHFLEI